MQQQQQQKDSCKVHLPDGRCIDICTPTGANAFLQSGTNSQTFEQFSGNVATMSKIRSKRRLNAGDKETLVMLCFTIDAVAQYSDHDVFRQCVPEREISVLLDWTVAEIQKLTSNRNWIATGNLQRHDAFLLNYCISLMMHAVPTALVFENGHLFFPVLTEFLQARKMADGGSNDDNNNNSGGRGLPNTDISESITLIVSNAYMCSQMAFDNTWTSEKALKKLEATGILTEFIRCATVPQYNDPKGLFRMLDEMQTCTPFLRKKFAKGEPCGNVVLAILQGKDGSRQKRSKVINKLQTIVKFVSFMDNTPDQDIRMCRNCAKSDHSDAFQQSLMKCARCQSAYYCSKECQR